MFSKKSTTDLMLQNKEDIKKMADELELILMKTSKNEEIQQSLKYAIDKVKYFNPSIEKVILDIDKRINNKIGDLKIEIVKAKNERDNEKFLKNVKELTIELIEKRDIKSR